MRPSLLLAAALAVAPAVLAAQDRPNYMAAWGSSADDVWIVGSGTSAMHWDGSAWSPVALPAGNDWLLAIWGSGEDDVWAVGLNGRIVRYLDGAWTTTCVRLAADAECERAHLVAVAGFGADDVYVAAQSPASDIPPRLFRFDGRSWSVLTVPLPFQVMQRGLVTVGADILLAGTITFDPTPGECAAHPLMGTRLCALSVGVVARLSGTQWTVVATADASTGGTAWSSFSQAERTVLASGASVQVANGAFLSEQAYHLQTLTLPASARGAAAASPAWTRVPQPTGTGVTRAVLFPRGEIVAATSTGFARRRLNSWTMIPVEASAEPGALRTTDLEGVIALWGASAADVWIVAGRRVMRLEGNVPSLAFEDSCEALGARAMGTPNCPLFRGAAAPARPALPMPTQRRPRP